MKHFAYVAQSISKLVEFEWNQFAPAKNWFIIQHEKNGEI